MEQTQETVEVCRNHRGILVFTGLRDHPGRLQWFFHSAFYTYNTTSGSRHFDGYCHCNLGEHRSYNNTCSYCSITGLPLLAEHVRQNMPGQLFCRSNSDGVTVHLNCRRLDDRCRSPRKRSSGGGKSELRRAVCRITSGTDGSSHPDGQCNREHTASRASEG